MLNLWGLPIWVFLVCGAVIAVPTLWKIRLGTVRGPLSILLSAVASILEMAAFTTLVMLKPFVLHLQVTALLTLSSWLLETWAKRAKISADQELNDDCILKDSTLKTGSARWYSK